MSISVGCNNTCTFCIVPSLRGKEKDRRPGDILAEVEALELKGRINLFASALRAHLPHAYPEAVAILLTLLAPPSAVTAGMFTDSWHLLALAAFVEHYGLDHEQAALEELMRGLAGEPRRLLVVGHVVARRMRAVRRAARRLEQAHRVVRVLAA